ncbi:MAG: class I SAM-dependent methyltransferase [Candidatus Micrarchaeota archaeon]
MKKTHSGHIDYSNPWYSGSQEAWLEAGPARHHHKKRVEYLVSAIRRLGFAKPKILDAGCGDGAMTKYLVGIPGASVTGVDYNPKRIKRAKKLVPKASFRTGNLYHLPFKNNSFDIVLIHHVLEHVKEDERVLRELHRVAKPNGILIVGVPNEGEFIAQIRDKVVQRKILDATDHENFYTITSLSGKVGKSGFEVIETKGIGGVVIPHHGAHMLLIQVKVFYELLHTLAQVFPAFSDSLFVIARKKPSKRS